MSPPLKMPRVVKGKRPQFFDSPSEDLSVSMIMVLAQELAVLKTRLDAFEGIAAAKGMVDEAEIENYVGDDATLVRQEKWRQDLLDRLFYLLHQQAAEIGAGDTDEKFQQVIDKIAQP